ncbi:MULTISPECIES: sulfurtransferase TusA family protein [Aliivibrio]|jgi:TusA-related sulfurtransferase|uniref:Response regulator SirA n=2 Tax=Aliivibrio logei TaxID=688 RepID=A0A1B9NXV8_ALILO|nr:MULTISPECIES: sulfurtransferase TusA family protein [Aliivibrio]MBB1313896.1 sulfurtransferase TusA family protein [Aliivibrio sp. SR45-2]OCH20556.1 response regulator SirA [Aliivibrio logei]OEF19966.1 response regulator SirA [Aliivibrio logei 5S-186]
METQYLDLSKHRCPMSLLLAKRASHRLIDSEKLIIKVVDKVSLQDMMTYFQQSSFHTHLEQAEPCSFLTVTRSRT